MTVTHIYALALRVTRLAASQARRVLRAVTYNNLGCFFKSMNKLHTAAQSAAVDVG